ncbi:MAG: hypothetical protein R3204_15955, partial [Oceanospirillum sp.]|nr:hypothetical protein [Oceanospirillum sp.]
MSGLVQLGLLARETFCKIEPRRVLSVSIGIFWFIPQRDSTGEVFGVCEPYKLSDNTRTGLLDSSFEHWQVWEQCPGEAKLPAAVLAQEYFHF